ncbi:MAG: bifunctional phosphoserine phosphatase/homoserine phosphotransferase ThrH [Gammaproteobacteria bacterium]|nr:bifunctional phosphoserine phosphatase/homoserine phosphotransferase ThrH [Gammaproteobacteria bacterium]
MNIACLDFEGVLVPEIWIGLAERTGIEELRVTTREMPDYHQLMRRRLGILAQHGIKFRDLQAAAEGLEPLPGAREFLDWLRARFQVAIVSDTYYELAGPLIAKLGHPMLLCHRLRVDGAGNIADYVLRQEDPKRHTVRAFKSLRYRVLATGDSYNDIPMLEEADSACLFRPPEKVVQDYPAFPVARSYEELKAAFLAANEAA